MEAELPKTADVVIIGGGAVGVSAAYHLARRGAKGIVLVERGDFFGGESTAKCAGGVRYHFSTEVNVRLSLLSLPRLDRFEEETGYPAGYRRSGYLFVLTREADEAIFRGLMDLWRRLGVRTEWWSGDEVRARVPLSRFPDALAGIWGPDDGLADPGMVVQGFVSAASRLGARLYTGVEAVGVKVSGGKVESVETPSGAIATRVVVDAAGAWSGPVGRMVGLDVPVAPIKRQVLVTAAVPGLPADFPFVVDFARSLYFHREGEGLLTGMSKHDQPPGFDQTVDPEWELVHLEAAAERMPLFETIGIARRWAGLYEVTPDHHPIIGQARGPEGFYLATGFSGHGFMHSPGAGLVLAEAIVDGRASSLDLETLRLERFREGRPIPEAAVI